MKPTQPQVMHHVGVVQEDIRMGLDQSSIVHLMNLLTDLYSDPQMAVIREYSTNAYDSNIEAGNPSPIIVTLPTTLTPEFKVQDNGVGLNVDDLKKVYSLYGASTKRDSNLVNGMLGLGCKSALTYALSFTVTAVKGGVKTIALVTKESDGVGTVKVMDTVGTTEGNGVTVVVPVQQNHVNAFVEKAQRLYRHWPEGSVLVNGEEPDRSFLDDAVWVDPDIGVLKQDEGSKIVMGNVAYPWPNSLHAGFQHSIIATVPIGSVEFTPAREQLQEFELTKDTLATVMAYVKERFPITLRDKVREAATPFAQAKILHEWRYVANNTTKGVLKEFAQDLTITHDRDRVTWLWAKYDNSCSKQSADWRYILDEARCMVITEFPFKAVSQSHRSRLDALSAWCATGVPNSTPNQALILPEGATIGVLEGRENVLSWDDVLALTPEPPKAVRAAAQKLAKYKVVQAGATTEIDVLDPKDGPIVWRRRIDPRSYNSEDHLAIGIPEAQVVKLYERQVEKFKKLHPTAVNIRDYHTKEVAKAKKALTRDDMECVGAASGHWSYYNSDHKILSVAKDPDLRYIAKLIGHAKSSATFKRADQLGVAPTEQGKVYDVVKERYPLMTHISYPRKETVEDFILYLDSKYESLKPKPKPYNGGKK